MFLERGKERHYTHRVRWLRAGMLGANDGIVSTASLIIGVAAATADRGEILVAGVAGLVAGAMSMAAGEYISVSSQADTERADLVRERRELDRNGEQELAELAGIYVQRGLAPSLAREVAAQLMAHDAIGTHAREELGILETFRARPGQAACTSATGFALGASLPLFSAAGATRGALIAVVAVSSLLCCAALGAFGAKVGGAPVGRGALRVTIFGALAMALTAGIGAWVGSVV